MAMASDSEEAVHDSDLQQPLDPLSTSSDHGDPTSIPPPAMMPLTTVAMLSQRRRRKHSASLKRSASTPNVRGLMDGDVGMTLAEKRRNKLGYHRTSVACGHCRRRKIRCLLAPDDVHNRCANCIRLKKDCNFFPVDQQPQLERRPRTSSRADTMASSSSDSSPALAGNRLPYLLDRTEEFNAFQQPSLSAPFTSSRGSIGGLISPLTRGPITTNAFELPPQNRLSWESPFLEHGPTSAGHSSPGDSTHAYWGRHSGSPMTPGFSPHLPASTASIHSAPDARSSFTSFAPSRSDSGWSSAQRSMSFGLVEDLSLNYHNQNHYHPQSTSMDYRRRASDMHPPSLQTSNNSSNTSISEAHMTPLSVSISSPPLQHWGAPTTWGSLPNSSLVTKGPDQWYSEPTILAKVQEEDFGPHYGGEPAIIYADADPQ
ncbi:MAG: hypothetical protein ASARMPRED_002330 [Alectoria sarmentosa]|nr:MAG: hypothetical protein ASARMPRED_002330 [Alectoria sarmentosa]